MENLKYESDVDLQIKSFDDTLRILQRRVDRLTEFHAKQAPNQMIKLELNLIKDSCNSLLNRIESEN